MVMSMVLMTGCRSEEKVISGDVAVADNGGNEAANASDQGVAAKEADQPITATEPGYVFVYQDATISVDGEMAPVLEALGEPASYYEAESCAFKGLDKIYTYNDFQIETYPQGEKDLVSLILFKTDAIATPEGIYVGSLEEELMDAYGRDYAEERGMIVYEKNGMKLCFIVTDGAVSSIQYVSTVLEE